MKIDRHNYEIFFIDYLEGNLSTDEINDLNSFLEENPDLKLELSQFENLRLTPQLATLDEKDSLKKSDLDFLLKKYQSFEEICVSKIEGELSLEEEKALLNYIAQNPDKEDELNIFRKTILAPDNNITYQFKSSLKRHSIGDFRTRIKRILIPLTSTAAILIFGILLLHNNNRNKTLSPDNNQVQSLLNDDTTKVNSPNIINNSEKIVYEDVNKSMFISEADNNPSINIDNNKVVVSKTENSVADNEIPIANSAKTDTLFATSDTGQNYQITLTGSVIYEEIDENNELYTAIINEINREFLTEERKATTVSIEQYSRRLFRKQVLNEVPSEEDNRKFSLWDVADAGLNGLRNLFDSNFEINRNYDDEGNVSFLAFESRAISFSTPLKK